MNSTSSLLAPSSVQSFINTKGGAREMAQWIVSVQARGPESGSPSHRLGLTRKQVPAAPGASVVRDGDWRVLGSLLTGLLCAVVDSKKVESKD